MLYDLSPKDWNRPSFQEHVLKETNYKLPLRDNKEDREEGSFLFLFI